MSTPITLLSYGATSSNNERAHRRRIRMACVAAILIVAALTVYGWDYYTLTAAERPFSPKHELLKPSGTLAIKLGVLGVLLFCVIFLYPLRKRVRWLKNRGSARHWLDFHIVAGVTAPVLIAFHASFKFRGIAGVAFWFMVSVALSGIIGRYVYAQIPRSLNSAEVSLKELHAAEERLTEKLAEQKLFASSDLGSLLNIPSAETAQAMPVLQALVMMVMFDLARPYRIARLRRLAKHRVGSGSASGQHDDLENVIALVKEKSSLAKRVAFLARSQQIFHLWHVIHRPFSYSFAVLAVVHLVVVFALGFM